jgi:hypothetical protein
LASLGIGAGSLLSHAETFDTRCGPPPGRVQGNFTTNIIDFLGVNPVACDSF